MTKGAREGTSTNQGGEDQAAPYKVGYGKPPVATRFPRGRSGNPLGRPRSPRDKVTLGGAMRELLMSDVTVAVDGRRRRMLRIEALVDTLIASAFAGNASAARLALDLTYRFVPPDETIADMHEALRQEALKHGAPKSTDAWDYYSDEDRARMSYESLTSDMTPDLVSGGQPSDDSAPDDTPSDDSPSAGTPPADEEQT